MFKQYSWHKIFLFRTFSWGRYYSNEMATYQLWHPISRKLVIGFSWAHGTFLISLTWTLSYQRIIEFHRDWCRPQIYWWDCLLRVVNHPLIWIGMNVRSSVSTWGTSAMMCGSLTRVHQLWPLYFTRKRKLVRKSANSV